MIIKEAQGIRNVLAFVRNISPIRQLGTNSICPTEAYNGPRHALAGFDDGLHNRP
jgi:hypothetical protein